MWWHREMCIWGSQGKWASSLDETSSQLGERGGSDCGAMSHLSLFFYYEVSRWPIYI